MSPPESPNRRAILLAAPALLLAGPGRVAAGAPFRLGLTPVFLDNEAPVIDALTGALSAAMGRPITPVQRRTYAEVTELVLDGDVDAAWLCGYPWIRNRGVLGLVATPLWQGRPLYRSYLIAGRDDPARALSDLRGGAHAFSDPDSNSGWLVTASDLAAVGARPESFFRRTIFAWGHRNVVRAVASGLTRSGSVDGYVYQALAALEPGLVAQTRLVTQSEWTGFPPIVARRDRLASSDLRMLAAALEGMAATPQGAAALRLLQLDGFAAGDESIYAPIAARVRLLASRP